MLKIFMLNNFSEKAVFSKETAKNRSGGAFDHFLGKGDFLGKKLI